MASRISIPLNRNNNLKNLKVDRSRICFITTYPFSISTYDTDIKDYEDFRIQFDDVADIHTIELCPYKTSKLDYLPDVYKFFCGNNFYCHTQAINDFLVNTDVLNKYEYFCLIDGRVKFKENYWLTKTLSKLKPNKIFQGFKTAQVSKEKAYESAGYIYSKQNYNLENIMFLRGIYGYLNIFPSAFKNVLFPDLTGVINYNFVLHQCFVDQIHHRDIMRTLNNYYIENVAKWLNKLRDNGWTEKLDYIDQQIEINKFTYINADDECWRQHEHTLQPTEDFLLGKFNKRIPVHFNHDYRRCSKQK